DNNKIEFKNVQVATPNGDVLVKEMSIKVERGMNVLVTGPNGCGKSSLFRILGSLWPIFQGELIKPDSVCLFYQGSNVLCASETVFANWHPAGSNNIPK